MTDAEWLAALKVGDEVAIDRKFSSGSDIDTITHTTPTRVMVGRRAFRRKDGRSVGSDIWSHVYLRQVTPRTRTEHRRKKAIEDLTDVVRRISKVPTDRIEAALALLTPEPR